MMKIDSQYIKNPEGTTL